MDVGLSLEIDADVSDKAPLLYELSRQMEEFFKEKSYGNGVETLVVGVICVAPEALFFFRERCKYNKKRRLFEYDVHPDPLSEDLVHPYRRHTHRLHLNCHLGRIYANALDAAGATTIAQFGLVRLIGQKPLLIL